MSSIGWKSIEINFCWYHSKKSARTQFFGGGGRKWKKSSISRIQFTLSWHDRYRLFWIILTYDDPPIRHSQSEMSLLHTCENTLEMVGSCPSQTPSNDSVMDYAWKTHDSPAWWKKLKILATHVTLILHAAEFFFKFTLWHFHRQV